MLTCEVCGKLHPPGTATCEVCGAALDSWPYIASSDLGQELGLDRLPAGSELGRVLFAPLRELSGSLCPFCHQANRPGAVYCANCGHTLVTSPTAPLPEYGAGGLPPGTVLHARYRIVRRIAQGGMGAVYEAEDQEQPGQLWAIKEMVQLAIAPDDRTQALKDFMREATLLATLMHPNLPYFNGIFSADSKHYLVMEYIPGRTLEQVVTGTSGLLPEARVLNWVAQLCSVLTYLHAQDPPVIYRDMKPGNIMLLDADDHIKLIDFGIARFHRRGRRTDTAAFGTAGYAPPEQYGNGQTDQRSDVYALAATAHHLLTGHDPVQNPFHWRPVRAYNPHVSARVDQALLRALELKPELRFSTVDAFAQALGLVAVAAPASAPTAALPTEIPQSAPPAPLPVASVLPATTPIPVLAGPLADGAGAFSAPAQSGPAPAAGPQLAISDSVIDLGRAGRQARKGRPVRLLNTGAGQLKGIVHVTQPWLAASAVQFQGNVGELVVTTRRRGLRFARLALPVPNVFAGAWSRLGSTAGRGLLIAWLALAVWMGSAWHVSAGAAALSGAGVLLALLVLGQIWLWLVARHVRWLVPAPQVNTGEVIVDSNGGQRRVAVRVLAQPAWLRRAVAWLVVTALLVTELLLLATLLLTQVLLR